MQRSFGSLEKWTVANVPSDDGEDGRHIALDFVVPQRSNVSMAVAALTGEAVRLSLNLAGVQGGGLSNVSARVDPPWSAKKRGGFFFRAHLSYSTDLVMGLIGVTFGQPIEVGIDVVQEQLAVEPDRQAAMEFVSGGVSHA